MQPNEAIRFLNLSDKPVCIHAALSSFHAFVPALPEVFLQAGCTVLVPTFSDQFEAPPVKSLMPEQNGAGDYSYFLNKHYEDCGCFCRQSNLLTVEEMGVFPQMILQNPARIRGNNFLNSFTALGPLAQTLIEKQTNEDVYAPLNRLYELDGLVLLMGVELSRATAIHFAEQKAGRMPFVRWAKDQNGKTVAVRTGGCSDGFQKLALRLRPYEKTVTVLGSLWRCYRMRELVDECEKAFRENPTAAHCADPGCERCNDAAAGGPKWK